VAQNLNLKANGLYTAPNSFSGVPGGALLVADDVVIDQDNVLQPRRGFDRLDGAFPLVSDRAERYDRYKDELISHYGGDKLARYDSGVWTDYSGSYPNPDDTLARSRFIQADKNLYFTTSLGLYKLDDPAGTPVPAGVPRGLDLQLSLTGSSGFFLPQSLLTFTATTTSGSAILTNATGYGSLAVGNYLSGTNIAAGSRVASITAAALVLSTTATLTASSTTIAVTGSATGIAVGQLVSGNGIPSGATVTNIAGTPNIVISAAATAAGAGTAVTFSTPASVTMDANATGNGSVTVTASAGSQIAYRVLWGYRDANDKLILGAPSQFATIANNTGLSRNVAGTSSIPSGVSTNYFYQVYRSSQTATIDVAPNDQMQQVYEAPVVAGDLVNGYVSFTDITPDSLRGAALYSSANTGEGPTQINLQPPVARDVCVFRGFTFYANVTSKQRLELSVLSIGAPSGVQVGDVLTIDGITYTAAVAENIPARQFLIVTTGTPAQNITDTVSSLLKVINRSTSSTVYAYLESGPTDLPGQILIEERTLGSGTFAVTASANGTAYLPNLPTSGTTVSSTQDELPNGIYVSKQNQSEAVPPANLLPLVGDSSDILRVIPLRDYVIVWKKNGGIFRITGNTLADFSILPTDLTVNLIAPDSAVPLANAVWAVSDQGIVSLTDSGVQVRSRPIEDVINGLFGTAIDEVTQLATAIAYETDRRYILSLPANGGDEANQQSYCFNLFTNAWTRWERAFSAGFIDPATRAILGCNASSNVTVFERKTGTYRDYIDELLLATTIDVIDPDGYSLTLAGDLTDVAAGDLLYQSDSIASVIESVDAITNIVVVRDLVPWTNGDCSIYPAIRSLVQWVPVTAGNPGAIRQYQEGALFFRVVRFGDASIEFFSENSTAWEAVDIEGSAAGGWGLFPWGSIPWGGVVRPEPFRFYVPQDKQYATQLNVRLSIAQAWSNWQLQGVNLVYEDVSEEIAG
jgi:hypothetical protein